MSLIPFLTIIVLFFFYQLLNKHYFGVVSLLFLTYIGMFFASFLLNMSGFFESVFPLSLASMTYFTLCLTIMFLGFMGFRDHKLTRIKIENLPLYRAMEFFLIVGGFSAIAFFLPFASFAISGDLRAKRIAFDAAAQVQTLGRFGLINSFFSLVANLFILAMICSFINLIPLNGKRRVKRSLLLMFSSLSYVVYVLAYVGRDGVVFWVMSFIFCFLLFRPGFIPFEYRRKFKRLASIVAIIIMIPFLLISVDRFKESPGGIVWSFINYYGQQVNNLNDKFTVNPPITYGRTSFPVFVSFLESSGVSIPQENDLRFYMLRHGTKPWVFGTYISSFLSNFGRIGTMIFILLLSLVTRITLRKSVLKGVINFSNLIIFTLIYQFFYWGVFYFRQYSANYYIIFMVLLFVLFKLSWYPTCYVCVRKQEF